MHLPWSKYGRAVWPGRRGLPVGINLIGGDTAGLRAARHRLGSERKKTSRKRHTRRHVVCSAAIRQKRAMHACVFVPTLTCTGLALTVTILHYTCGFVYQVYTVSGSGTPPLAHIEEAPSLTWSTHKLSFSRRQIRVGVKSAAAVEGNACCPPRSPAASLSFLV